MGSSRSLVLSLSATLLTKDATNQTTLMFLVEWNQKKFKKRLANCQSLLLRPLRLFTYSLNVRELFSYNFLHLFKNDNYSLFVIKKENIHNVTKQLKISLRKTVAFFLTHLFGTTRVTTCVDFLFRGFNGFRPTTINLVL